jgi:hypothetical protein
MISISNQFWDLIESRRLRIDQVCLICNAPLKILLLWHETEVPESALRSLQQFLGDR